MRLRVWERGAGLTLACGSGACAAVVNAYRRGLTGRVVAVQMDGGLLEIEYTDNGLEAFTQACAARGTQISIVLRDRDLVPAGSDGYVYKRC